jgi:hypothetical protein
VAEWEASVAEWKESGPLDATISGDLANPRDHSVLLVATVEAIPCSIKHIDGVSKEEKTSLPKLANFTCSEIFVDHKQNGVHPRQTEDGSFSVEVCISSAGAGSCLPAFTVQAIERLPDSTAKQTNINVKLDDQNTEHQVINHFDKTSSNKDIRYVWRDGYVQGEDELENLQNLMEVWVSLYIGGYNAFVRWAPRVPVDYQWSATDWAQKWKEAQVSSECAQIDIEVEAFRNVNIDFYEYSLDKWLDTEPNLSDLTKWGGTQRVGVVYAPGSAKFKDPGSSSNNLSLSFDKDRRTVYYPGTTVYCVFSNCKEFTYDLEYLTDVNEVLDEVLTNSSDTLYFRRNLEGSISPERWLSFPGISLKLAMPEHMGTSDCFSILIGTFDVITVKRRTITTGDPYNGNLDATARTFVSTLPVSPFGDGLVVTKKDIIHTHARRTRSQTHGARRMVYYSEDMWNALPYVFAPVPPTTASGFLAALRTQYVDNVDYAVGNFFSQEKPDGYTLAYDADGDIEIPEALISYEDRVRKASDPNGAIDQIRAEWNAVPYDLGTGGATVGRGKYRIEHETQTVMELEIKYLRGYHDVGGIVRLGQDTWEFSYGVNPSTGSVMGTQTGYALAGTQIEFATGGKYTFPTTHDPNETRINFRYALPKLQINDGVPFELDGTRKLYGIHSDPQYNDAWGNIFADLRSKVLVLTDPSSIELSIYGDKLYGDADHQIDLASLDVGKNNLQMAEFDLPFTVTAEHSFISGARLLDASYRMAVILTPAELVLTSDSNFHGLDGAGITDHVVLNSPHDYHYVPALASVLDVRNVNAGNLLSDESCPFSLTESKVSVHFKYGTESYRSLPPTMIPENGILEFSQWQNPSSPDGRNLRPDPHMKLEFSSRSHPWVVTKEITGGAYELVVFELDKAEFVGASPSWTKSTTSLGVDLMATETPLRFDSGAGDMGVEIVLHDRFFDEADIHEGFAWEVAAANTPLLCKAPRYIDQNSGSSTETVPLAQDPLMILNEAEFTTNVPTTDVPTTDVDPIVPLREDNIQLPLRNFQIIFDGTNSVFPYYPIYADGIFDNYNTIPWHDLYTDDPSSLVKFFEIQSLNGPFTYWDPSSEDFLNGDGYFIRVNTEFQNRLIWYWDPTSRSYINPEHLSISFQFFDDMTLTISNEKKGTYQESTW